MCAVSGGSSYGRTGRPPNPSIDQNLGLVAATRSSLPQTRGETPLGPGAPPPDPGFRLVLRALAMVRPALANPGSATVYYNEGISGLPRRELGGVRTPSIGVWFKK